MSTADRNEFEQRAAADRAELELQLQLQGSQPLQKPPTGTGPALAAFLFGTVVGVVGLAVSLMPLAGIGFAVAAASIHRLRSK